MVNGISVSLWDGTDILYWEWTVRSVSLIPALNIFSNEGCPYWLAEIKFAYIIFTFTGEELLSKTVILWVILCPLFIDMVESTGDTVIPDRVAPSLDLLVLFKDPTKELPAAKVFIGSIVRQKTIIRLTNTNFFIFYEF